jgi:hypothetical protein
MRRLLLFVIVFAVIALSPGCTRVKPWERDVLSRDVMTFDREAEESALDHGYYNAREGAAGGFEAGGGGCGCN